MSKSKYADIIKKAERKQCDSKIENNITTDKPEKFGGQHIELDTISQEPSTTRKKRFPGRKYSYDIWERSHFAYLIKMRNIYIKNILENISNIDPMYLCSDKFLQKFCEMIYENSSKTISKYLQPLSADDQRRYVEYKYGLTELIVN